ncbi:MAG: hypothetical protein HFI54_07445 [Lachnospiraceae bacterium]|nr:hypothetical protein [Lachnospiraceae bacterium]
MPLWAVCKEKLSEPPKWGYRELQSEFTCEDPFVKWCIGNKDNAIEAFHFSRDAAMKLYKDGLMGGESEIAEYENGGTPWCITYTFMPDELEEIICWRKGR